MSEPSGSRTTVHIACSKRLKEQILAAATAKGQSMSDFCVDAISDALKFSTFISDTDTQARKDDWETMAALARDGEDKI